jgi:catechol 2,3-dioxygenase-like lactoylglutathione lyase family enzyme
VIDHLELSVTNLEQSTAFYRGALAPLGYDLHVPGPGPLVGFGVATDKLDFWLRSGDAATPRPHFAFHCTSRALVVEAYTAAMRAGGVDNGAPAVLTRIHPTYFAGFVRDPDGHNVEFVCHRAEP